MCDTHLLPLTEHAMLPEVVQLTIFLVDSNMQINFPLFLSPSVASYNLHILCFCFIASFKRLKTSAAFSSSFFSVPKFAVYKHLCFLEILLWKFSNFRLVNGDSSYKWGAYRFCPFCICFFATFEWRCLVSTPSLVPILFLHFCWSYSQWALKMNLMLLNNIMDLLLDPSKPRMLLQQFKLCTSLL